MANKFPIGQSFQRLTNSPLDPSKIFDTLEAAENYAMNGPTSYVGQIIYIKDVRTNREIQENVSKKDGLFIIDNYKTLRPLFKFILSTLKMDTGEGLSYNGIIVDGTDISSILGGGVDSSDDIQRIEEALQDIINEFNDYKDHDHEIDEVNTLETKLEDLQDNIDNHTHTSHLYVSSL